MKKFLQLFVMFCFMQISITAQHLPDFYFQKTSKDIIEEFEKDTINFKIKKSDFYIDVYCKHSNWAMKFFYNQNSRINLVVFATSDQETAQKYFDYNESNMKHIVVEDFIQWLNPNHTITFKIQQQSLYLYQFTYSLN